MSIHISLHCSMILLLKVYGAIVCFVGEGILLKGTRREWEGLLRKLERSLVRHDMTSRQCTPILWWRSSPMWWRTLTTHSTIVCLNNLFLDLVACDCPLSRQIGISSPLSHKLSNYIILTTVVNHVILASCLIIAFWGFSLVVYCVY